MKRFVFILIAFVAALSAMAASPNLNVESLFDGRYNSNNKVETTIMKRGGQYYRGFDINNDTNVIKQIRSAIDKDKSRAADYTYFTDKDGSYTSMKFLNNGETIFVGLQINKDGTALFFIHGKEKAFK